MTLPEEPIAFLYGPFQHLQDDRRQKYLSLAHEKAEERGFQILVPNRILGASTDPRKRGLTISDAAVETLRKSHVAIFDLTAFRGVHADVSTTLLLGLAAGLKKPCFAFTSSKPHDLKQRTLELLGGTTQWSPEQRDLLRDGKLDANAEAAGLAFDGRSSAVIEDCKMPVAALLEWAVSQTPSTVLCANSQENGLALVLNEARRFLDELEG